jgi:hypothetical protein
MLAKRDALRFQGRSGSEQVEDHPQDQLQNVRNASKDLTTVYAGCSTRVPTKEHQVDHAWLSGSIWLQGEEPDKPQTRWLLKKEMQSLQPGSGSRCRDRLKPSIGYLSGITLVVRSTLYRE